MSDHTPFVVTLSARALRELQELRDYIAAEGSPLAAERYAARLLTAIAKLEHFPERGRRVGANIRELTTVPPYVVRYIITGRTVDVVRIRHAARRPS